MELFKFKKRKRPKSNFAGLGFSLIELMVTMVVISVLLAAFMPIVTKKMKSSSTALKLSGGVSTKCTNISNDCKLCSKNICLLCTLSCPPSEYKDTLSCTCKSCSIYSNNCLECNDEKCKSCIEGYGLTNTSPYCTPCQITQYSDGTKECKTCPSGQYTDTINQSSCMLSCMLSWMLNLLLFFLFLNSGIIN